MSYIYRILNIKILSKSNQINVLNFSVVFIWSHLLILYINLTNDLTTLFNL